MDSPLFVTWTIGGNLRGCIGTFAEDKLGATIQKFSLVAAVRDTRFPPMTMKDMDQNLRVEVSLLSDFEKITHPLDWEIGKHGIEIEFKGPANSQLANKTFRGTYLP